MNANFTVWSDGSGYKDGFGGWAVRVRSENGEYDLFRMGCMAGTTVDRMELTGMLEGLQVVFEWFQAAGNRFTRDADDLPRPQVKIYSDRENLVLSIKKVYDRSNALDLWARFECYEKFMTVMAEHVMRETDFPEFMMADLHASSGRIIAKNYVESVDVPPHLYL